MASTRFLPTPTHGEFRFNSLPIEVRLMIWELAIPDPRIVYIKDSLPTDEQQRRGVWSPCPPPSMLRVNREASSVASKYYERTFVSSSDVKGADKTGSGVWIDLERDILFIDQRTLCWESALYCSNSTLPPARPGCDNPPQLGFNNLPKKDAMRVKNLAVAHYRDKYEDNENERGLAQLLVFFGGVQNFYVVMETYWFEGIWTEDLCFWEEETQPNLSLSHSVDIWSGDEVELADRDPLYPSTVDVTGMKIWINYWNTRARACCDRCCHNFSPKRLVCEFPEVKHEIVLDRAVKTNLEKLKFSYDERVQKNFGNREYISEPEH